MNKKRITGRPPGPAAELRFTAVRAHAESVEFEGHGGAEELHRFSVPADALQALTEDDCPPGLDLIRRFERCKPRIFGVASRAFNAGVRGDPIVLRSQFFDRHRNGDLA